MNIRLGDETQYVMKTVPAKYVITTDAQGVEGPAVQETPAQYTIFRPAEPVKTPWALIAAAVGAYVLLK